MAQGVIPISTNVGGVSEHIKHGHNGFLINSKHPQAIIDEFVYILETLAIKKKLQYKISKNAHQYAIHHFSRSNFNSAYRKLLLI
jgi:glycosyltransferase involved in cell wall biosynthesis